MLKNISRIYFWLKEDAVKNKNTDKVVKLVKKVCSPLKNVMNKNESIKIL